MKVYDKALWHIDAGENKQAVLEKFKAVFAFLNKHNLLSAEGIEIYELGIDESVSLHERLLTEPGNQLINQYYDAILSLDPSEVEKTLDMFLESM